MVLARLTIWRFKAGMREDAFTELDSVLNTSTRNTAGFRGYMSMLSHDDVNVATTLTLWQDHESLRESEKGVFADTVKKIQECIEGPPTIMNYVVFSTELFLHPSP